MPTRAPDQHALHFYSKCGVVDLHVYVLQSISGGYLACLMTNYKSSLNQCDVKKSKLLLWNDTHDGFSVEQIFEICEQLCIYGLKIIF